LAFVGEGSRLAGVTVDPSLARGLVNRAYREGFSHYSKQVAAVAAKYRPYSQRKGSRYKAWRKALREGLADYIILEQTVGSGKQECTLFTTWANDGTKLYAELIVLLRKNPEPQFQIFLVVSRHAAERVFERLNSTQISCLEPELLPCVIAAMGLFGEGIDPDQYPNGVEVETLNGMAVLRRDSDTPWTVVTWIADKKPRASRGLAIKPLYRHKAGTEIRINVFTAE
jgi:hypothetical protein